MNYGVGWHFVRPKHGAHSAKNILALWKGALVRILKRARSRKKSAPVSNIATDFVKSRYLQIVAAGSEGGGAT